ncbi:hypothetical protein BWI15_10620 [Kribbella sp. ALI-6-A]|uniref:LysR family transcriptional regulator n=1 Tax=Kribbella sp. ALI-6-A TaxID=1933817 RepID=UPI00097BEAA6|nr:LysR substrate-binding domain-containing protein [Kribbella sp. ALI-6-A]ONI73865.1 hypothetical protein BWI15_10620 [Kribbella sp. ALI-6-A]
MLDVRKLVLLREVGARGSIAAAADALAYTRSAVSQQLTALERDLGVPLLDRTNRRAALTEAGHALVARTEVVLAELEQAEAEVKAPGAEVAGELRIGVPLHHGPPLLARSIARLQQRHPGLLITLSQVAPDDAAREVRLGKLDLALSDDHDGTPKRAEPGLVDLLLASDPLRVAVSPGHPLAGGSPFTVQLRDLAGDRWVLDPASSLGVLTLSLCRAAGFEPRVAAAIADPFAALTLAATGWAVALVPDLVADREGSPTVRLALDGIDLRRRVRVLIRSGSRDRPAVTAFLAELEAVADEP